MKISTDTVDRKAELTFRTPKPGGMVDAPSERASALECGTPVPLWQGSFERGTPDRCRTTLKAALSRRTPKRFALDSRDQIVGKPGSARASAPLSLPKTPSRQSAFTLLEICISITVFTFIMISVIGCWKCIISGTIIAQDAAAAAARSRIGMKTMVEALTCVEMDRSPNLQYYWFEADTSEKFATLSLAARLPGDFPGSSLYGDIVMRRVTFDIEKDADGKDNLIMSQSPLLAIVDQQNTPYRITLARDVNVFMLEFWSPQEGDWVQSWDYTNQLPRMVRVTLGSGHSADNPEKPYTLICRTVAIPSVEHN